MASSQDSGHSAFEQASWAASIIGGVISVFTLTSIIVLLAQISLERRNIEDAKHERVVGRWRSVLTMGDDFGIRPSASVPLISLPQLVAQEYKMAPSCIISPQGNLALSGWANFLDILGVTPDEFQCPSTRSQAKTFGQVGFATERTSELVERRLPMRWNASEFVCICSLLGFQHKAGVRDDYDRTVLPLPTLWYGPPGKVILRESSAGITVSFRPNVFEKNMLPKVIHGSVKPVKFNLKNRAFQAVHALPIGKEKGLFFGGKDSYDEGVDSTHAKLLWEVEEDRIYWVVETDLLQSWGLDCKSIIFLKYRLIHQNAVPSDVFPMGRFLAPRKILPLLKEALTNLIPDGYIFTANQSLAADVISLTQHSYEAGSELCKFYALVDWDDEFKPVTSFSRPYEKLRAALKALSVIYLRYPQLEALLPLTLTPGDCQTVAQLCGMLHEMLGGEDSGKHLRWAMVCSPSLVQALVEGIHYAGLENVLKSTAVVEDELFSSQDLLGPKKYCVPNASEMDLVLRFEYTGQQILAAVLSFTLTGIWLLTSTQNNVCYESLCIPESIFMI